MDRTSMTTEMSGRLAMPNRFADPTRPGPGCSRTRIREVGGWRREH